MDNKHTLFAASVDESGMITIDITLNQSKNELKYKLTAEKPLGKYVDYTDSYTRYNNLSSENLDDFIQVIKTHIIPVLAKHPNGFSCINLSIISVCKDNLEPTTKEMPGKVTPESLQSALEKMKADILARVKGHEEELEKRSTCRIS